MRRPVHKFRCVPHPTGRHYKHGVLTVTSPFRDAYHLAGIDMPDFHRDDDWWRMVTIYLDNLAVLPSAQPVRSPRRVDFAALPCSEPRSDFTAATELLHHISNN